MMASSEETPVIPLPLPPPRNPSGIDTKDDKGGNTGGAPAVTAVQKTAGEDKEDTDKEDEDEDKDKEDEDEEDEDKEDEEGKLEGEESASSSNSAQLVVPLQDFLVLRVEHGRDYFLSLSANFCPSQSGRMDGVAHSGVEKRGVEQSRVEYMQHNDSSDEGHGWV